MTEAMKKLLELDKEITQVIDNIKTETKAIKERNKEELAKKIDAFKESIKPYVDLYEKHRADWEFSYCGHAFKDNLRLEFSESEYGNIIVFCNSWNAVDEHCVSRQQKWTLWLTGKSEAAAKNRLHDELFVDVMNNWETYFQKFEESFMANYQEVIKRKVAKANKAYEYEKGAM